MFGFGARKQKPIKVGSSGPTLFTGPRRSKLGSAVCDRIGEFLYEVVYAVLFKYGGFEEEDFEPGVYGKYTSVQVKSDMLSTTNSRVWKIVISPISYLFTIAPAKRCSDAQVKQYAQDVVTVARDALKQNKLRTFEVSIVDGVDFPLATFSIQFRRRPHFRDSSVMGHHKELDDLVEEFAVCLQTIQKMGVNEEMRARIEQTETRLQLRLQVSEDFVEQANDVMNADSKAALQKNARFAVWSDPITNVFNQLIFTSIVAGDPSPNECS